ncbi:GRAM domain-containing protein 2B isoform X2 [Scleropages formosus]|uniref:GRAM domain-containing protein 2B isoform X2 n=1 Tax=Scleropages formosus TaxID=113540 RepID=UPI0008784EC7|nr:GRAM domain-containing protein 2B isoform X2 [Scleropages formosus]
MREESTPPTCSEAENMTEEKQQRWGGRTCTFTELSVDAESEISESRRKPPFVRSKAIDQPPVLQSPSDYEPKLERTKSQSTQFSKANAHYHKTFKEISKDELLRQSYTCALQKDILYQGKLFVSDNWICFYSKVFGKDTKIAIPVHSVTFIKKTKTAILVPNALVINTTKERHVFVSFLSRDTTYKCLKSICLHLDGDNMCSSPSPSSVENSFRVERPASIPLDFSRDFTDLDRVVRHRRLDAMESSSSGSQTPDYEKIPEFSSIPQSFLSGEVAVHADVHCQQTPEPKHCQYRNGLPKAASAGCEVKSIQPSSLNTLIFIYLFLVSVLVFSSCYMAFKIVALEERLNSLGSKTEYPHNENVLHHRVQAEFNAEIYGELSTNLFKLEKIQKNLQKLLEDT